MKRKKPFRYPLPSAEPMVLRDASAAMAEGLVINIRAAKDQLSSLIEQVSQGNEVIITSDGKPKAKLVPVRGQRQIFRVNWELLKSMPLPKKGSSAEQIVREDRDGRP